MTSIEAFDPAPLLAPIPGDLPCGVNLEFTPGYDAIRLARQSGDSGLPAGLWEREVRKIDWADIQRRCEEQLTSQSKDLQLAAWLLEALVQRFGMDGMVRGMDFFATFTETFWDGVYPPIEEADASLRMKPVDWLLRESAAWLGSGRLTFANAGSEDADAVARLHDAYARVEGDLTRLEQFLNSKAPDFSPSFEELRRALQERRMPLARQMAVAGEAIELRQPGISVGMTREAAYEQLESIARFLQRTEPHSPVPMVLSGLVGWRNATFVDLLQRLPQGGPSIYELLRLFDASATDG